ncbi:phosphohistidine phosphatase SixA [Vibrio sp. RC27]
MKIYIMRHGEAGLLASCDAERTLTQRGKDESLATITQSLDKMPAKIDKVFVSPYVRAQETWQQIAPLLDAKSVELYDDITPYGQSEQVYEYVCALAELENLQSIMFVSHLPLVGYLTAEFVADLSAPMFPTSGLACVEFDVASKQGELLWQNRP